MLTCDLCNQPTESLTTIPDKRFKRPMSGTDARICNDCYDCWKNKDEDGLFRRIKLLKLKLGGKE